MKWVIYFQRWTDIFIVITLLVFAFTALPAKAEDTPSDELLQMAEEVSERACRMAVEARETKDYYQAQHAFALASEALPWVFEVLAMAQKTSNPQLANAAQDAVYRIGNAISLARDAALEIAASTPDPEVAHAVNFLLESCEMVLFNLKFPSK